MEQWDIKCCRCGKFILTEQKQDITGHIKCVRDSYENGFYSGTEDKFYCTDVQKKKFNLNNKKNNSCYFFLLFFNNSSIVNEILKHKVKENN